MKTLAARTPPLSRPDVVITAGMRELPYLADHGLQEQVVLPGSFYVDLALRLHHDAFGGPAPAVCNARFHRPIVLSSTDALIAVQAADRGASVDYTFFEPGSLPSSTAQLEIQPPSPAPRSPRAPWPVDAFQASATVVMDAPQFYQALIGNGNRYGGTFQQVSSIWRTDDRLLARILVPPDDAASRRIRVIDAAVQLLSAFTLAQGRTFVLVSIDRIDSFEHPWANLMWGQGELRTGAEGQDGLAGDVRLVNDAGETCLLLSGVRLALLPRPGASARPAPTVCVSATFTAEPIADSLNFWAHETGLPIAIEFPPFNQVFQQLLDPRSAFARNTDGANVLLLRLESWADTAPPPARIDEQRAGECFGNRPRRVLPNGLDIVHLNRYETDYLYTEIFEDQCYMRHGIRLEDDATVIDVGANIGMFSLFVCSRAARARVFAYEPSPVVCDLLRANCAAYGPNVRVFNAGVAETSGSAPFTFYPNASVFSGFHADALEDGNAVQAIIRNMLADRLGTDDRLTPHVETLAADRLHADLHQCRTTSVSAIIRDHQLAVIDLLKIDAEKSELGILAGIADEDWARIRQVVIEVHDPTGANIGVVERLLTSKGFSCTVDQSTALARSGLFNLFAVRADLATASVRKDGGRHNERVRSLERNVDACCRALRSFTSHSTVPLILACCPVSAASRHDSAMRAALADAEARVAEEASQLANVHTLRSASMFARYQLADGDDPHRQRLAHIPYTPDGFAAIGTSIFRVMSGLVQAPAKVIVLDCDHTLWRGVCAEDGPHGVELTPAFTRLQTFMAGQLKAGRLLCLCSKNDENDVLAVFRQRPDMVLREEHFIARRINWRSKSDNLRSLASELNLGLDSFIFVDDSPMECAEVRRNCPGVLVLQLPQNSNAIADVLDHVWAFDAAPGPSDGQDRTTLYRQHLARKQAAAAWSLDDFLRGLDLRISIAAPMPMERSRVSELTFRTNQFNCSTIRRSEIEIREFLARDDAGGLIARVSDRFGVYGLVGAMLYTIASDRYHIDTFLLSCRVLGKGVEHAMLAAIAAHAVANGTPRLEIAFTPTPRNVPAADFLRSLEHLRRDASSWLFDARDLAHLEYHPEPSPTAAAATGRILPLAPQAPARRARAHTERAQCLGHELRQIVDLSAAIDSHRGHASGPVAAALVTADAVETSLAAIWQRATGVTSIGLHRNFFDAGGTSLNAVSVLVAIKTAFQQDLSIVDLFAYPTISSMAARLRRGVGEAPPSPLPAAAERGHSRRSRLSARRNA